MRVCIVGGGLTGAAAAATIRQRLPEAHIELWDKAKRFGGRMCTKQSPSEPLGCSVDVGAQYISSSPENYTRHCMDYTALVSAGVLQPLACRVTGDRHAADTRHFVAPRGMTQVVQHFVSSANCQHRLEAEVSSVDSCPREHGCRWRVATTAGTNGDFDVVLLTLPVPQMLALHGEALHSAIDEVEGLREGLCKVQYSSRFCLALFYHPADAAAVTLPGGAGLAYISNDSPFCYLALDNIRRGIDTSEGFSVMVHTTRQFGASNLEQTEEAMLPVLQQHFSKLMPHWPPPCHAFCHKWRYSQVTDPVCKEVNSNDGSVSLRGGSLVLSGDAFTSSNVDGCLTAAASAAAAVVLQGR